VKFFETDDLVLLLNSLLLNQVSGMEIHSSKRLFRSLSQLTYLTPPDIWTLEVCVKEQVKVEGNVLARVVHAHVHVQLLLAQDQPVRDAERAVPHGARVLSVGQAKDRLNVARVQPLGALLNLPPEAKHSDCLKMGLQKYFYLSVLITIFYHILYRARGFYKSCVAQFKKAIRFCRLQFAAALTPPDKPTTRGN
jgi:hypothetical protein